MQSCAFVWYGSILSNLSNFTGMTLPKVGGYVFFLTSYNVIWTQNQYVSDPLSNCQLHFQYLKINIWKLLLLTFYDISTVVTFTQLGEVTDLCFQNMRFLRASFHVVKIFKLFTFLTFPVHTLRSAKSKSHFSNINCIIEIINGL